MDTLTFEELRTANVARCCKWHPGGLQSWSLSDWGVALAGEVGEACNVIKKLNRERDGIRGNDSVGYELQAALADELADIALYLDLVAATAGVDLGEAIRTKFNKTSEKVGFEDRL